MAAIIPRWEWRTFGPGVEIAAPHFAALTSTGVQESDETYLLSGTRPTAKVRDGLMDIKSLVEADSHGLEQWKPVMKVAFPLVAADVGATFAALGLPAPPLARDTYTYDQFVAELAGPGGLRPVAVHKRRVRYVINGCTSEVTDVTVDGIAGRTVAIESEDEEAVIEAVASVGLAEYVNTSYARGLAALLDGTPPRYAVIDVGTNSVKFHVGERQPDGSWRTIRDRADVTRLGEGLEETGSIADAAAERTAEAIAGMVAEAETDRALAIAAVGTAGLRIAKNSAAGGRRDPAPGARPRPGHPGRGGEPARVPRGEGRRGAGRGLAGRVRHGRRLHPAHLRPRRHGRRALERGRGGGPVHGALRARGGRLAGDPGGGARRPSPRTWRGSTGARRSTRSSGMGGAITNITAVKHGLATYDPDVVQGTVLDRAEIDRQIELYRSRDAAGRREIVGLQPKRADVILAGACIVRTVMDKLGRDSLTVSDRGLRHGLIVERFGG